MNSPKSVSFSIPGSLALVTGGASGIGHAITMRLLTIGVDVVVVDKLIPEELIQSISSRGYKGRLVPVVGDVSEETTAHDAFEKSNTEFGRGPDILFNNAGVTCIKSIIDTDLKDWNRVVNVILKGTLIFTKKFGLDFQKNPPAKSGVIVNTTSTNAIHGTEGLSAYSSAKAAVKMFTEVSAMELGQFGIRANALSPGFTKTPLSKRFLNQNHLARKEFMDRSLLNKLGEPDDLVNAAMFLISSGSSHITGLSVEVDGGMHLKGVPNYMNVFSGPI